MTPMPPERTLPLSDSGPCPLFRRAEAKWNYPVVGYCTGLPGGLLMIPTVEEQRSLCSSAGHARCPIHQAWFGPDALGSWFQADHDRWALPPLGGRGDAGAEDPQAVQITVTVLSLEAPGSIDQTGRSPADSLAGPDR
jgi:hypothetical protein